MHIKKGMLVRVISGNYRGQQGKVLRVFPKQQRVIVEGINFIKRATRPSQENPGGGFVEKEAPIHISNVMAVYKNEATRVGYKFLEDGRKVRIAKKKWRRIRNVIMAEKDQASKAKKRTSASAKPSTAKKAAPKKKATKAKAPATPKGKGKVKAAKPTKGMATEKAYLPNLRKHYYEQVVPSLMKRFNIAIFIRYRVCA